MTCIIGYVEKEKVYMGADSASVGDLNYTLRKDKKVFRVREFLIGGTTSFRMLQLLQYSFIPPKIKIKNIYKYMCTDFINEVRKCFIDNGFMQKFSEGDDKGGVFLVGVKGKLFKIDSDFQVEESILHYNSCGCGEKYALAAIDALNQYSKLKPEDKIFKALEITSKHTYGVSPPFIIMNN